MKYSLLSIVIVLITSPAFAESNVTLDTQYGKVMGRVETASSSFKGIPFAAPPVGGLRWKPPAPPAPWANTRDALAFPPICPQLQSKVLVEDEPTGMIGQEDCLYLNVWTPALAFPSAKTYPVMVFIHGGAYLTGSTSLGMEGMAMYDGKKLAESQQRVVVTIQYRLGALGFTTHPGLINEAAGGSVGNYATLDQIAALKWVKQNIAHFAGDPGQVTIFGESAGAHAVGTLFLSPLAQGLFQAVISESGHPTAADSLATAQQKGIELSRKLGCEKSTPADSLSCLRAADYQRILENQLASDVSLGINSLPYVPVIDNHVLTDAPLKMIEQGKFNRAALFAGQNAQEYPAIYYAYEGTAKEDYEAFLQENVAPAYLSAVKAKYSPARYRGYAGSFAALSTDIAFTCPTRIYLNRVAVKQNDPLFRYVFTQKLSGKGKVLASFHGLELLYVFGGILNMGENYAPTSADVSLSQDMQRLWGVFASAAGRASLNPSLRYTPKGSTYFKLDSPITVSQDYRSRECDLLGKAAPQLFSGMPR